MFSIVDMQDGVPIIHQIGPSKFVIMSYDRYMELFTAEQQRDAYKHALQTREREWNEEKREG